MRLWGRIALVAVVVALAATVAFAVGTAARDAEPTAAEPGMVALPTAEPTPAGADPTGSASPTSTTPPTVSTASPGSRSADPGDPRGGSTTQPTGSSSDPSPSAPTARRPELVPGPALLAPGDQGAEVRELQARLAQIDWFDAGVTGYYGDVTREAVRGFQAKREIPVTGEVDARTLQRLEAMTTEPTEAELHGGASAGNVPGPLDARCLEGRVLCVDKSSNTLRWVVDGQVRLLVDVRFGSSSTPTREGVFSVFSKSRDHVSTLYDTSMPFAMFFSGGQAVHYSPDFAAVGYAGASHGCVNVRDYDKIAWLFDQVAVGDRVVVYWS